MAMDLDRLRVFHAVACAGSLTHAGEELALSQSAVSRQISALEDELKVPLFSRHARGLVLTEQGARLFDSTKEIFNHLQRVEEELLDSREAPRGDLRVTATVGIGTYWLTPRLRTFVDTNPDVRIHLILHDGELDLIHREADIALRMRQPVQSDLIQRKLFDVTYHIYASPDYIARKGEPGSRRLGQAQHHHLRQRSARTSKVNWLADVGRKPGIRARRCCA
jgi:DNA-binding transcriptional LysR family regulator